jgi:uncharacterized iron-regulated membrane protein
MNKEFVKRLTLAHGWIGLVFSGLLFIIFFAGSIALFRQEITLWSMQPHFPITSGENIGVNKVLDSALADRNYDPKEHITLLLPSADSYYYKAYIDIKDREQEPHYDELLIDPVTGEIVNEGNKFDLADFIYRLHYNLNIPFGKYVLGFVTLFFLFALISGIFIHARKFISNFFKYRGAKHKRSQLLDMHNVVGVISLPFTIMYAISGLIFNLLIIYQISIALVLYNGDGEALLKDAGIESIEPEWQDKPIEHIDIDKLITKVTKEYQVAPRMLTIYNYGDKSAVIQFRAQDTDELTTMYNVAYSLNDEHVTMKIDNSNPNTVRIGVSVLRKLHYGNYAGLDLRVMYLILGFLVCALIVTGNLLWIEKREKQRTFSARSLSLARYATVLSSTGIIISTCIAFLYERLIPIHWLNRVDILGQTFWVSLAILAIIYALPKVRANYRQALAISLYVSAGILLLTLLISLITFNQPLIDLFMVGSYTVFSVDLSLFVSALLLIIVGRSIIQKSTEIVEKPSDDLLPVMSK